MSIPIDVEAKNKLFVESLSPGMLVQMAGIKTNIVLLHADRLLEIFDEKERDFSDLHVNELDDIIMDKHEEVIVSKTNIKKLDEIWFILLSPTPINIWNYNKSITLPPNGVNCLRFVEILWEEKRVFLCYASNENSLLEEEWRIHGR